MERAPTDSIQTPIKSKRAMCEEHKALVGREPTTYGFERQRHVVYIDRTDQGGTRP